MKKFELLPETRIWRNRTVHRIRALQDFSDVRQGDLGGFVESSDNLSHHDKCWIYHNAIACDDSLVRDDAALYGRATALNHSTIGGEAQAFDDVSIAGLAVLADQAKASGKAQIEGYARIRDHAELRDEAYISGRVEVGDHVILGSNAQIYKEHHYMSIGPIGSRNGYTNFFRNSNGGISVICGCFTGNIDEFIRAVKESHHNNIHTKIYLAAIELAKMQILRD